MPAAQTLSVADLTTYIAQIIGTDYRLKDLWIEGEVSNFRRYTSGHAYFTLKDANSQLKCVMWNSALARQMYIPMDGDRVRAHGKVEVYVKDGQYQLYADSIQPSGMGALYQQFERLKAKLNAEGLFDPAHKRPLPPYPRVIGVVTSPQAAAFQDIQNVLRRRYPVAAVLLSPTAVQGDAAPPQIVRAIKALCVDGRADVIVLARGGGSIEDLWAFNDESVARAVYESTIPVVTGVGHEIDFTIVDFVSDYRAPTPSAAAEVITPDIDGLRADLDNLNGLMRSLIADMLRQNGMVLKNLSRTLGLLSPAKTINTERQRVDDLSVRTVTALKRRLALSRERLTAQNRALEVANPINLLGRGYAIVTRTGDGKRLSDATDAGPGAGITITLARGELRATVRDRTLPPTDQT